MRTRARLASNLNVNAGLIRAVSTYAPLAFNAATERADLQHLQQLRVDAT